MEGFKEQPEGRTAAPFPAPNWMEVGIQEVKATQLLGGGVSLRGIK